MVATGGAWTVFTTGTSGNVLYGADLNKNFSFVSLLVNKAITGGGITGGNIANGGIDSGALIAANVITHNNLNFNAGGGCRVVQIGKAWTTTAGQFMAKGTALVTATNLTNTDVTIYFTGGDVCTAGEPVYQSPPHVYATVVTADPLSVVSIKAVATNSALINIDPPGSATFAANWTLRWMAIGDV